MQVSIHIVSDASTPEAATAAVAIQDTELLLTAVAFADVQGSLLERDLGNAAAQLAIETVRAHVAKSRDLTDELRAYPGPETRQRLLTVMKTGMGIAGREIDALARRRKVDIQVVIDVVIIAGGECFVAHMGDGRVQLLRKGLVHVLTLDHVSADAEDLPHAGGANNPFHRPRPSRALGLPGIVDPELLNVQLSDGDRLLLASPWLYRGVDGVQLQEIATDAVPDGVTARLLGTARDGGVRQDLAAALVTLGDPAQRNAPKGVGRLSTLARIPLFAYCTERELLAIAGITRPICFHSGATVFREGDQGQGLFLVVAGSVSIVKEGREIARLTPGANFGEMSMLDEPRRSATVRTNEDTELLLITRDAFFSLLRRDPTLAVKVLWNMLLRISANLRATSESLARAGSSTEPHLP